MDYCNLSVKELMKRIGDKSLTPGSGAVGAVIAALSASLGSMAAELTLSKSNNIEAQGYVEAAKETFESEAIYLCDLVNKDVQAFEQIVSVYRLPDETPQEINNKELKIQQALKTAIEIPFDLARRCKNIIICLEDVAKFGHLNILSEVESASHMLIAVLKVAKTNTWINMRSLDDPIYANWIDEEMSRLEDLVVSTYDRILTVIKKRNA
ncbi:MAG: methenyltetrahydrofolate cyclohydrolase [Kosmotogales bacterium]|nr:methenyltetrahydrofolate cyclohydrolase [Kosmotogales bacterium]